MPATKAAPKLIFFDLDGTLLNGLEFSWKTLWEHFGTDPAVVREPIKQYLNHEITYQDWVDHDIQLLRAHQATKTDVMAAFGQVTIMPGALETLAELKRRGYLIFVVSGGIDVLVEMALGEHRHYFEAIFINKFHFSVAGRLTSATATPYDMEHKATCITDMAKRYGTIAQDCVFVGDNSNDLQAMILAGTSIAFNCKSPEAIAAATHHVEGNDISQILPLLA